MDNSISFDIAGDAAWWADNLAQSWGLQADEARLVSDWAEREAGRLQGREGEITPDGIQAHLYSRIPAFAWGPETSLEPKDWQVEDSLDGAEGTGGQDNATS
jgi:hypothetical protein